jgi:hypothetical protein
MANQDMAGFDDNTSQQEVQALASGSYEHNKRNNIQTQKIHSKVQYQHEMDLSFPAF